MAARQFGFLNAERKGFKTTRIGTHERRGVISPFPTLAAGRYLWEIAIATGLVQPGMNGPVAMPWSELVAIGHVYDLDCDEIETLRKLSVAFLDGLEIGGDPLALSPMEASE